MLFFQLFIFIMIETQWIDLAQFIENKGDCMKNVHGGLQCPRPPAEKLMRENFVQVYITIGNSISL